MEHYKIIATDHFESDLTNYIRYVSSVLNSPITAKKLLHEIRLMGQTLSSMPYRHPIVEDAYLNEKEYRKCIVKNMLIFYKVVKEEKTVYLHRIFHANQNWIVML